MMKIISITLIFVIILSSTVVSFSKKAIEDCITENAYGVKLSPSGNKLIYEDKDDNIVLYNIASKRIEIKYPLEGEELSIDWYEWKNDIVLIHGLDKQKNTRVVLKTKDFKHFTTIYQYDKNSDIRFYVSNGLNRYLICDKENNKVEIQYKDNTIWETGINSIRGYQWSYDDEFLLLDNENEEVVLLNSEHKYSHNFKERYFDGVWAPSKNFYLFSTYDNDIWTKEFETGLYLFNPENQCFKKFNYNNNNIITKYFIWSIDSKYILAYNVDGMDLLEVDYLDKPAQELVRFNKRELQDNFYWSEDMKYLYFIYAKRTINFFKPWSIYAARISLKRKNIESIYIGWLIGSDIWWADENTIIYGKGNDSCLYRSELKW